MPPNLKKLSSHGRLTKKQKVEIILLDVTAEKLNCKSALCPWESCYSKDILVSTIDIVRMLAFCKVIFIFKPSKTTMQTIDSKTEGALLSVFGQP